MAIDMPPAPPAAEYRIQRSDASQMSALYDATRSMTSKYGVDGRAAAPVGASLPRIDPTSRAMTQADRGALAKSIDANAARDMSRGVEAPSSYVGDRVRLATLRVRAMEASAQGRLTAEQAHEVRCRTAAVAMDRRAGAYVQGGERAAAATRASVSPQLLEQCRATMARHVTAARVRMTGIDPATGREHAHAPKGVETAMADRQLIDPTPSARVRIDPEASRRTSIDPTPSHRVRIDPVSSQHRQASLAQAGQGR